MRSAYHDVPGGGSVHLMSLGDGSWMITSVEVQRGKRRRGTARRLMERVCAEADAEGAELVLLVDPQEPWEVSFRDLWGFYESLGFSGGEWEESASMYRPPLVRESA